MKLQDLNCRYSDENHQVNATKYCDDCISCVTPMCDSCGYIMDGRDLCNDCYGLRLRARQRTEALLSGLDN